MRDTAPAANAGNSSCHWQILRFHGMLFTHRIRALHQCSTVYSTNEKSHPEAACNELK